jgi:hypothetical protein
VALTLAAEVLAINIETGQIEVLWPPTNARRGTIGLCILEGG